MMKPLKYALIALALTACTNQGPAQQPITMPIQEGSGIEQIIQAKDQSETCTKIQNSRTDERTPDVCTIEKPEYTLIRSYSNEELTGATIHEKDTITSIVMHGNGLRDGPMINIKQDSKYITIWRTRDKGYGAWIKQDNKENTLYFDANLNPKAEDHPEIKKIIEKWY